MIRFDFGISNAINDRDHPSGVGQLRGNLVRCGNVKDEIVGGNPRHCRSIDDVKRDFLVEGIVDEVTFPSNARCRLLVKEDTFVFFHIGTAVLFVALVVEFVDGGKVVGFGAEQFLFGEAKASNLFEELPKGDVGFVFKTLLWNNADHESVFGASDVTIVGITINERTVWITNGGGESVVDHVASERANEREQVALGGVFQKRRDGVLLELQT